MHVPFFVGCLFFLQILCILLSRKQKVSYDETSFFLASRSVGWLPLTMTFLATQMGGGSLIGLSEEAYRHGYAACFLSVGTVAGFIILGCGPGRKLSTSNYASILDIFSHQYHSKFLRKMAFILSTGSLFCILAAQLIALIKICLNIPHGIMFALILWGMLTWYTSRGGLLAVIRTDMVQVIFMVLALSYVCVKVAGNIPVQNIEATAVSFVPLAWDTMISWIFVPFVFMFIEQDMLQRCFAAKSKRTVTIATLSAGMMLLGFNLLPVWLGVTARGIVTDAGAGSIIALMVQQVCGDVISSLLGAAVVVAILSTADSLMNALAQLLHSEIALVRKHNNTMGIVVAMSAWFFFPFQDSVFRCILVGYGLSVCCLSVPVLASFFGYSAAKSSAYIAVIVGGMYYCGQLLGVTWGSEIIAWSISLCSFMLNEVRVFYMRKRWKISCAFPENDRCS